ncbi:UNVERIFIED_CONTAM: Transcription factor [Sesamum latifolium]|uniref:Transcription factor n=1 Tax=Sesamum latifolium TaxID=2727402 RepID=A0AAW2VCC3_9LAMI
MVTGGAAKKARIQPSSAQSTFKTDTASVLLEAIGYIRFLQSQIEAQGERNCLFPEDSGQECDEEPKKDLRSRGLCLVPISCTLHVGSDNGADYWAPAFGANFR